MYEMLSGVEASPRTIRNIRNLTSISEIRTCNALRKDYQREGRTDI